MTSRRNFLKKLKNEKVNIFGNRAPVQGAGLEQSLERWQEPKLYQHDFHNIVVEPGSPLLPVPAGAPGGPSLAGHIAIIAFVMCCTSKLQLAVDLLPASLLLDLSGLGRPAHHGQPPCQPLQGHLVGDLIQHVLLQGLLILGDTGSYSA